MSSLAAAFALASCTFSGLGDYDVETCGHPVATTAVQTVGPLGTTTDVGFTSSSGRRVIAAFVASVTGGTCVQGIDANGYLDNGCSFLSSELTRVPRQPAIVPIGAGRGSVMVATSAPCTQGQLLYRYAAPGVAGGADGACVATGAALPAAVALPDGATAVTAYYATTLASREDPIADCGTALGAPLMVSTVASAAGAAPRLASPIDLADDGAAVRPPAMLALANTNKVLVAAPHAGGVGVWTLDASLAVASLGTISELTSARAVSVASDGAGRVAVAAEIGCAPQAIALAVGDGTNFPNVIEVSAAGSNLAVQPTVAWVDGAGLWLVSWITSAGGGRSVARWVRPDGSALSDIDATVRASAAIATANGDLFAFVSQQSAFVDLSVGCAPLTSPP